MTSDDRERGNPIAIDGARFAANVKRIRLEQGLSLRDLSTLLKEVRPISPSGLSKIENATRRVDVDDLMALSVVLNVNPNALLLTAVDPGVNATVDISGASEVRTETLWSWALGRRPLTYSSRVSQIELRAEKGSVERGKELYNHLKALHEIENSEFQERVLPDAYRDPYG